MIQEMTDTFSETIENIFHSRPCEGQHHQRGLSGHNVDEFAAFFVTSPCCGPKLLQCASRVSRMVEAGSLWCSSCRQEHATSTYTFTPL